MRSFYGTTVVMLHVLQLVGFKIAAWMTWHSQDMEAWVRPKISCMYRLAALLFFSLTLIVSSAYIACAAA